MYILCENQLVRAKAEGSTRQEKGEYFCDSALYRQRINPGNKKKLVILEDEAEVVCRVFDLTNQRYFKMEICRVFNEEGGIDSRAVYEQTTEIRQQESCLKRIAVDE